MISVNSNQSYSEVIKVCRPLSRQGARLRFKEHPQPAPCQSSLGLKDVPGGQGRSRCRKRVSRFSEENGSVSQDEGVVGKDYDLDVLNGAQDLEGEQIFIGRNRILRSEKRRQYVEGLGGKRSYLEFGNCEMDESTVGNDVKGVCLGDEPESRYLDLDPRISSNFKGNIEERRNFKTLALKKVQIKTFQFEPKPLMTRRLSLPISQKNNLSSSPIRSISSLPRRKERLILMQSVTLDLILMFKDIRKDLFRWADLKEPLMHRAVNIFQRACGQVDILCLGKTGLMKYVLLSVSLALKTERMVLDDDCFQRMVSFLRDERNVPVFLDRSEILATERRLLELVGYNIIFQTHYEILGDLVYSMGSGSGSCVRGTDIQLFNKVFSGNRSNQSIANKSRLSKSEIMAKQNIEILTRKNNQISRKSNHTSSKRSGNIKMRIQMLSGYNISRDSKISQSNEQNSGKVLKLGTMTCASSEAKQSVDLERSSIIKYVSCDSGLLSQRNVQMRVETRCATENKSGRYSGPKNEIPEIGRYSVEVSGDLKEFKHSEMVRESLKNERKQFERTQNHQILRFVKHLMSIWGIYYLELAYLTPEILEDDKKFLVNEVFELSAQRIVNAGKEQMKHAFLRFIKPNGHFELDLKDPPRFKESEHNCGLKFDLNPKSNEQILDSFQRAVGVSFQKFKAMVLKYLTVALENSQKQNPDEGNHHTNIELSGQVKRNLKGSLQMALKDHEKRLISDPGPFEDFFLGSYPLFFV